ncbi:MAG: tyrosine-protein phosphatase [Microbacterium sp.]
MGRLDVPGLANARDLGAPVRADGTTTQRGVSFRAEMLDEVTDDGWDALRSHGIRTVIDLRRPPERTMAASRGSHSPSCHGIPPRAAPARHRTPRRLEEPPAHARVDIPIGL